MHFRNSKTRNINSIHDRTSQTFRERSRNRYSNEKKDKEHELSDNQRDILKAINDHFEHIKTSREHGEYVVKFKNPTNNETRIFNFQFEDNYKKTRGIWENH